jgi:hypothetical protein
MVSTIFEIVLKNFNLIVVISFVQIHTLPVRFKKRRRRKKKKRGGVKVCGGVECVEEWE